MYCGYPYFSLFFSFPYIELTKMMFLKKKKKKKKKIDLWGPVASRGAVQVG